MRKKDYLVVAGSLKMSKEWNTTLRQDVYNIICENLANSFERRDPKFDRQKFLTACGILTLEQDIKEVAELETALNNDPEWRNQ